MKKNKIKIVKKEACSKKLSQQQNKKK